jgi:hypothetical protein
MTDDDLNRIEARPGNVAHPDVLALVAEVRRLRALAAGLADRVAAQSEILSRHAEKR